VFVFEENGFSDQVNTLLERGLVRANPGKESVKDIF
jgi:hypothetical protein